MARKFLSGLSTNALQLTASTTSGYVLTTDVSGNGTWQAGGGGGITWTNVTSTAQTATINNGYIASNIALVTITLPATAVVGSIVEVAGGGAGGWKLAQVAGQTVRFGSMATTAGVGGSLASFNQYDAVRLLCIVANTTYSVIGSQGNVSIV